jgi:nucleotide-binding universal stress UspA family protein
MFQRILVPVDLTEKSEAALEKASALALAARGDVLEGAAVCLVHVIETIRDVPFEELRDFYEPIERRAQRELGRHADALARAGVEVEVEVRYGNRVREIVETAREMEADLVLLGSHRIEHSGSPEGGLATISYQVAALAPCSVLLLKPSGRRDNAPGDEQDEP